MRRIEAYRGTPISRIAVNAPKKKPALRWCGRRASYSSDTHRPAGYAPSGEDGNSGPEYENTARSRSQYLLTLTGA
jgi:hypothetical protein